MQDDFMADERDHYVCETAAQHLARLVPVAFAEDPIGVVLAKLPGHTYESVGSVYVVDQEGRLQGIVHLPALLSQPPERMLREVMIVQPPTVSPAEDQERVAGLAILHGLAEVPVVDGEGRLEEEVMSERMQSGGQRLLSLLFFALFLGQPILALAQEEQPFSAWGKDLYMLRCASCHGESGKGDGPAAGALKSPPADLTQISKRRGGTFPRSEVIQFIDGERPVPAHGPRHMPVWGEVFRRERADSEARMRVLALTVFIESIQEK